MQEDEEKLLKRIKQLEADSHRPVDIKKVAMNAVRGVFQVVFRGVFREPPFLAWLVPADPPPSHTFSARRSLLVTDSINFWRNKARARIIHRERRATFHKELHKDLRRNSTALSQVMGAAGLTVDPTDNIANGNTTVLETLRNAYTAMLDILCLPPIHQTDCLSLARYISRNDTENIPYVSGNHYTTQRSIPWQRYPGRVAENTERNIPYDTTILG